MVGGLCAQSQRKTSTGCAHARDRATCASHSAPHRNHTTTLRTRSPDDREPRWRWDSDCSTCRLLERLAGDRWRGRFPRSSESRRKECQAAPANRQVETKFRANPAAWKTPAAPRQSIRPARAGKGRALLCTREAESLYPASSPGLRIQASPALFPRR